MRQYVAMFIIARNYSTVYNDNQIRILSEAKEVYV
jgi:hypothetical protein